MAGSFDYSPPTGGLTEFAASVLVCRYDPRAPDGERYSYLPNVFCEAIQRKESAEPPTAHFRYILDDTGALPFPAGFERLWPINSPPSPYKVRCGDRLVCLWIDPMGSYRVLWDGFAQLPQVDVTPRSQDVSFVGVDVSIRLWDDVVTGRWQRDGSDPETPGEPVQTGLPTRFNPDDLGNCTPDDADEEDEESGDSWPVFLEPKLQDDDGTPVATQWTMSKLARYLLWYYNNEEYVDNPDFSVLDNLLSCRAPKAGSDFFDPNDPATFTSSPIVVRDLNATNRPAMDVLEHQLGYAGFRMRFACEGRPASVGPGGAVVEEPWHYIEVYRFDAAGPTDPKVVYLGERGASLDSSPSNATAFSAKNDFHAVANRWTVETRAVQYEVGVVLAPAFEPQAGDESPTNRKKWLRSNQDSATKGDREKYRLYIADECGEGHWSFDLGRTAKLPILLADLFADPDTNPEGSYVRRYRPGRDKLFSLDPAGKPYRRQLKVSRDYQGDVATLWDGSGTWQSIDGGYRLLQDRLGIFIDIENPMEWDIGKPGPNDTPAQEPSGVLDAVTSVCNPGTAQRQKRFYLMLATVIDGDYSVDATADSRPASPYPFTVSRQVDAHDVFQRHVVDVSSPFSPQNQGGVAGVATLRDDTKAATTYAEQMRAAHEFPPISATITIPWFTQAYEVGDRIAAIVGRDVSLQTNAGVEQGEAPTYPFVVAVDWIFGGEGQRTVLQLSDRRNEPAHIRR